MIEPSTSTWTQHPFNFPRNNRFATNMLIINIDFWRLHRKEDLHNTLYNTLYKSLLYTSIVLRSSCRHVALESASIFPNLRAKHNDTLVLFIPQPSSQAMNSLAYFFLYRANYLFIPFKKLFNSSPSILS